LITIFKKTYFKSYDAQYRGFVYIAAFVCWVAAASADDTLSTEPAALDFTNTRSLWRADPNLTSI
jgi:hypothetical protein